MRSKFFLEKYSILIFLFFLISCSKESTNYTLSVQINPPDSGYVNPNGGTVTAGEQISLTATAADEYVFESWSGSSSGTSPNISVIMDSDKSITANFIKVQYNVEIIQTENGQIQVKTIKEGITNQTDYNSGTILELTAVPNEGFEFIEWGSNDENISGLNTNPLQITITKPIRIWAEWRIKQYVVKGNINGIGGFNLWANDDANQTFSFEITQVVHNTNLKLEARNLQGIVGQHRSECWKFNEWSGDKTGNENPSYIIINRSDIEVTANFKINEPSERKVSKQGEGDVNIELLFGSNDGDNYRCGSEFRITATPSSGWYFSKWEVTRENNNQTDYFDRTENPLTQTVYFNSAEKMNFKAIFLQN